MKTKLGPLSMLLLSVDIMLEVSEICDGQAVPGDHGKR